MLEGFTSSVHRFVWCSAWVFPVLDRVLRPMPVKFVLGDSLISKPPSSHNQAAPVSSFQWAQMVLRVASGEPGKLSKNEAEEAIAQLSTLVTKYNERPEVLASLPVQPPSAKKRKALMFSHIAQVRIDIAVQDCHLFRIGRLKGQTAAIDDDGGDDLGLMLGEQRMRIIRHFLTDSTAEFWRDLQQHLNMLVLRNSAWTEKMWKNRFLDAPSLFCLDQLPHVQACVDSRLGASA